MCVITLLVPCRRAFVLMRLHHARALQCAFKGSRMFAHFQRHPHLRDRSDQRLYGHAFVIFEELKQARDVKRRFSGAPFFVLSPASGGNVACVAGQHPVSLRK